MAIHNQIGKTGEKLACEYLIENGYTIADTNARIGHYELDIVAMKDSRIIFVEVKTRTMLTDSDPLDAIDNNKIKRLCRAANAYVRAHNVPHEVQFDVITVRLPDEQFDDEAEIEHYPDAFLPPLGGAL